MLDGTDSKGLAHPQDFLLLFAYTPGMGMYYCQQGAVKRKDRHRVLMNFMHREGWHCSFLEEDCKTSLPFKMTFEFPDRLLEIQQRYGETKVLEDISALEHGISIGRGGVWLILTPEQYTILCKPNPNQRKPPRTSK